MNYLAKKSFKKYVDGVMNNKEKYRELINRSKKIYNRNKQYNINSKSRKRSQTLQINKKDQENDQTNDQENNQPNDQEKQLNDQENNQSKDQKKHHANDQPNDQETTKRSTKRSKKQCKRSRNTPKDQENDLKLSKEKMATKQ